MTTANSSTGAIIKAGRATVTTTIMVPVDFFGLLLVLLPPDFLDRRFSFYPYIIFAFIYGSRLRERCYLRGPPSTSFVFRRLLWPLLFTLLPLFVCTFREVCVFSSRFGRVFFAFDHSGVVP